MTDENLKVGDYVTVKGLANSIIGKITKIITVEVIYENGITQEFDAGNLEVILECEAKKRQLMS